MSKSKEDLSNIAKKAVETRKIKKLSREMLCDFLELIQDGKEYHLADMEIPLAERYGYEDYLDEQIESGGKRFLHRIGWAKWFLKKAQLITPLEKAKFKINSDGLKFLQDNPDFTFEQFQKIPAWRNWLEKKYPKKGKKTKTEEFDDSTVISELLEKIQEANPFFFEKLVTHLLERMEYGIGHTTKKSHDGGIDGIVTADKLGLSEIYIQAKRYSKQVPTSFIREFIGTIQTTTTKTGVFITSGIISEEGREAVVKSGLNIQLIDGQKLATLMYDHGVGVKIKVVKPVKYLDESFFIEEELEQ